MQDFVEHLKARSKFPDDRSADLCWQGRIDCFQQFQCCHLRQRALVVLHLDNHQQLHQFGWQAYRQKYVGSRWGCLPVRYCCWQFGRFECRLLVIRSNSHGRGLQSLRSYPDSCPAPDCPGQPPLFEVVRLQAVFALENSPWSIYLHGV